MVLQYVYIPLLFLLYSSIFSGSFFKGHLHGSIDEKESTYVEMLDAYRSASSNPQQRLEPVSYSSGQRSLIEIIGKCPQFLTFLRQNFQEFDAWGSPPRYRYSFFGTFSPGLLFHIRNLTDVYHYCAPFDQLSIIEFSYGYGAETILLHKLFTACNWQWKTYTLVVPLEREEFLKWFLSKNKIDTIEVISIDEWRERVHSENNTVSYDLAFLLSLGHSSFEEDDLKLIIKDGILSAKKAVMKLTPASYQGDIHSLYRNQLISDLLDTEKTWKEISCLEPEYGPYRMFVFSD